MTNVSRTNRNGQRPASDLYQTPVEATLALVRAMGDVLRRGVKVWEPACGKLAIVEVLVRHGIGVVYGDKFQHLTAGTKLPFSGAYKLAHRCVFEERRLLAAIVMTNPPYGKPDGQGGIDNIADEFIRHILGLGPDYAIFFLPLGYWQGVNRTDLLEHSGLWRVYILRDRCALYPEHIKRKDGAVTPYAWFVWKRGYKGAPTPIRISLAKEPKMGRAA